MLENDIVFSYRWYRKFLQKLISNGYEFKRYGSKIDEKSVILRHDIDWSPIKAKKMSQLEKKLNITSTYFFLISNPCYNIHHRRVKRIINEIESRGHDIGLHFNTYEYWSENPGEKILKDKVQTECEILSMVTESTIDTVAFHMPPKWIFNQDFDGFLSTYEQKYFKELPYVADSNQRWRKDNPFNSKLPEKMQLLVHPGLWGEQDRSFKQMLQEEIERHHTYISRYMHHHYVKENDEIP